jgi:hypothetical protein
LDRFNEIVKQRLAAEGFVAEHPAADLLSAFAERTLRSAERERVVDHLSRCSSCRAVVALANSDVQEKPAEQPVSFPMLRFPAAMRWASATAALAIAIGVGVLIHQEQSRPPGVSHETATTSEGTVASVQSPCDTAAPGCEPAGTATKPSENIQSPKPAAAKARKPLTRNAPVEKPQAALPRAQAVDAFGSGHQSSANAEALDKTASLPSPVTPLGTGNAAGVGGAFQISSATSAKSADVTAPPQMSGAGGEFAAKRERASAFAGGNIAGSLKTPIVHWSISGAGQLQRRNWDDTVNVIEPASGSLFHAVAARGIEVWAGGSQQTPGSPGNPVLFHSSDAGTSWKRVAGPWKGTVLQIQMGSSGLVTIATEDGQWQTRDGGQSWTAVIQP